LIESLNESNFDLETQKQLGVGKNFETDIYLKYVPYAFDEFNYEEYCQNLVNKVLESNDPKYLKESL
jgi:hypothetical protein